MPKNPYLSGRVPKVKFAKGTDGLARPQTEPEAECKTLHLDKHEIGFLYDAVANYSRALQSLGYNDSVLDLVSKVNALRTKIDRLKIQ